MCLSSWFYNSDDEDFGYRELVESKGKGNVSPDSAQLERVFRVVWSNVPHFLDDLLGYSYIASPRPVAGNFSRVLPDEHPLYANFFAMDATVEGLGSPSYGSGGSGLGTFDDTDACCQQVGKEIISYPFAKITAVYKPIDYAVICDDELPSVTGSTGEYNSSSEYARYCTRTYSYASEILTLQTAMKFVSTGRVLQGGAGQVQFMTTVNMLWRQVPSDMSGDPFVCPTQTAIINCVGHVNDGIFLGQPAGCVLFIGAEPKMRTPKMGEQGGGDQFLWDVNYQFAIRNNGTAADGDSASGWNYFYDVSLGEYDLVTSDGTTGGKTIYQSADLTQLFKI